MMCSATLNIRIKRWAGTPARAPGPALYGGELYVSNSILIDIRLKAPEFAPRDLATGGKRGETHILSHAPLTLNFNL